GRGRFPASESLAFQEDFLEIPVIDIWALKFKKILENKFPDCKFLQRKPITENLIAVTEAFCYKKKGIVRAIFGFFIDLFQFKVKYVIDRIKVMLSFKKDPFDIYNAIIAILKRNKVSIKFMFQVSDFTTYDRNINYNRLKFQSVIKSVADYAEVGLLPGYYANENLKVLKMEKLRLEEILKRPVKSALNNKYNLQLPDTYNNMAELEILHDYSMGYANALGFRAGTSTPFLFYDLNFEVTNPVLIHPFCINLEAMDQYRESEAESKVLEIKQQVKEVGGHLIAVFTNEDFSDYANRKRNINIFKRINEIE
ncbi:MAG TPA: polysaccharide deacetylase family protein, partial [Salinimicrobium sp.]|nr:polysaccharide deacetylase family protein [Salinimicrobium sp.]